MVLYRMIDEFLFRRDVTDRLGMERLLNDFLNSEGMTAYIEELEGAAFERGQESATTYDEADMMEAREEAFTTGFNEGYDEGYAEGKIDGMAECEEAEN